jgi:hypothetical protein
MIASTPDQTRKLIEPAQKTPNSVEDLEGLEQWKEGESGGNTTVRRIRVAARFDSPTMRRRKSTGPPPGIAGVGAPFPPFPPPLSLEGLSSPPT